MNLSEKLQRSADQLPMRAERLSGMPPSVWIIASDEEKASDNSEVIATASGATLVKSFKIYRRGGLKIKYQLKRANTTAIPTYQIRKWNGLSETNLISNTNITPTAYEDYSETISVDENDEIRIYISSASVTNGYIQNLKVCFTLYKSSSDYELNIE